MSLDVTTQRPAPFSPSPLLQVRGLGKRFGAGPRAIEVLREISFTLRRGEVLGLVGESGSGKTTIGRCLLRLIEPSCGDIVFDGRDIGALSQAELRPLRGRMQYIFQDPFASLSPRMTVEQILTEGLRIQRWGTAEQRRARAREALAQVELPEDALQRYAFEFSGGQRQRIGIARALTLGPELLVADEPVSALDVSIQAQVVNLLRGLQQRLGLSMLFISHDLAVVEYICDRVAVLYLGRIVEMAPVERLYAHPRHPYTRALLASVPSPEPSEGGAPVLLQGEIPSLSAPPSGCVFRTRCPRAQAVCARQVPALTEMAPGHFSACLLDEGAAPAPARLGVDHDV
ncbi:ABC transporter ATP-binding protein [Pelomonas sp. CA6]|uniref:ABC transporter ATP-binding protein n=1 Tax=Pelomonas sp. CA6 TaxID=2907999 RepID=UPI001F4BEA06|nr:ABC transporter ATP-binding protein [Pelomonas sp. CA6]MCH7345239.1 ABC transporter ATP-binding protein [Pelomonas sp. CA6]